MGYWSRECVSANFKRLYEWEFSDFLGGFRHLLFYEAGQEATSIISRGPRSLGDRSLILCLSL